MTTLELPLNLPAKSPDQRTAYWVGRCPIKGCNTFHHLDVPMKAVRTTHTHHNHAIGTSHTFTTTKWVPECYPHFSPYSLGLNCLKHRREITWKVVNGRYSSKHQCNAKCLYAIGPDCECSCGGANHGRGYSNERLFHFS